jgi:hypothetical protein
MDIERLGHEGGQLLEYAITDGGQGSSGLAGRLMEGGLLEWSESEDGDVVAFRAVAQCCDTGGDVGGVGDEIDEYNEGGMFFSGFGEVRCVGQDEDAIT